MFEKSLGYDAIIFANTGAERKATIVNMKRLKRLAEDRGIPFYIAKHEKETIIQWCLRLGILPLLPSSRRHVCSQKYKAKPIEDLAKKLFPNERICFHIGIELGEGRRLKRFSPPKDSLFSYRYPLVELGMDRNDCIELLAKHGFHNIPKSACICCPMATKNEIIEARKNKKEWEIIRQIEHNFKVTSPIKHNAWLDAKCPTNKAGNCLPGHWKFDTWKRGHRLYAKTINGRQLSVDEWAAGIDSGEITPDP
jgi:hypothetical protein